MDKIKKLIGPVIIWFVVTGMFLTIEDTYGKEKIDESFAVFAVFIPIACAVLIPKTKIYQKTCSSIIISSRRTQDNQATRNPPVINPPVPPPASNDNSLSKFYKPAIDLAFRYLTISEEILQRKLNISQKDAEKIIMHLEACEIIGPAVGGSRRNILATNAIEAKKMLSKGQPSGSPRLCGMGRIDKMEGHEFEHFTADLLRRLGYEKVEVTRGSGDQGVDVLAEKDGVKYAIQCKCYSSDLGNKPVQEVNTGKVIYHCHVGVVVTNRHFTQGAKEAAEATGVLLWDREKLQSMIEACS